MNVSLLGIGKNNKSPKEPQLPVPQTREPPRLSHRAATVAQEMETLEIDLHAAQQRAMDQENRAKVAESIIAELKAELAHSRNERDHYHHLYTDVAARLSAVSSIILDVMRMTDKESHKQPAVEAAPAKIEQALQESATETPQEKDAS